MVGWLRLVNASVDLHAVLVAAPQRAGSFGWVGSRMEYEDCVGLRVVTHIMQLGWQILCCHSSMFRIWYSDLYIYIWQHISKIASCLVRHFRSYFFVVWPCGVCMGVKILRIVVVDTWMSAFFITVNVVRAGVILSDVYQFSAHCALGNFGLGKYV